MITDSEPWPNYKAEHNWLDMSNPPTLATEPKSSHRNVNNPKIKVEEGYRLEQGLGQDKKFEGEPRAPTLITDNLNDEEFYKLSKLYQEKFRRYGGLDDINKSVECGISTVNLTPANHPDLRLRLNDLGVAYRDRFERLGKMDDLDKAMDYGTHAVGLARADDANLPIWLNNLGLAYFHRFDRLGELGDIEKAIEHGNRAVELTPKGHPGSSMAHNNLGMSYRSRFERLGNLNDLEEAIKYGTSAVELTPNDHPDLPLYLNNLGWSYSDRFDHLGKLGDLEKAIEYQSRGVDLTPDDHPSLPASLNDLGLYLRDRFKRLGELNDLEKAIKHGTRAVDLTPNAHPGLPMRLNNLGLSYYSRFVRLGKPDDLEESIKYGTSAVHSTPGDHPNLPLWLNNLGWSYCERFRHLDCLDDLQEAIKYQGRAVNLTPDDHPKLSDWLNDLGVSHSERFQRLGKLDDLEQAIKYGVRAANLTPNDHPSLSTSLNNLELAYRNRFERLGELDDLEEAIKYGISAVDLTPDDHPDLQLWLSNLAISYSSRFVYLGELDDVEKAIEHGTNAVALTPEDHPDLPARFSNLGSSYSSRFLYLGELNDLEKGIKYGARAVNLTSNARPELPLRLNNLGWSYRVRFEHLGELNDLDMAIKYGARAADLAPDDHPQLPLWLSNWGISYRYRFVRLGQLCDLEKAAGCVSRGLVMTPDGHPFLGNLYPNMAEILFLQYQGSGDPSHLSQSLEYFRKGSWTPTGAPRDKFWCALNWAWHTSEHDGLNSIEAHRATMDLLPQFIWFGATASQRYHDLKTAENLATNASYAAILHSDHELAIEWLEQARCIIWSQSLMLRSPLEQLNNSHPALAVRLQSVAKQLREAGSTFPVLQSPSSDPEKQEQAGLQRRRWAKEYETLLAEARTLPDFQDLLRPTKANGLTRAARNGPVVVINCHQHRCDALLIMPGQNSIEHLTLPAYNQEKAQKARSELEVSLRSKGLRQRGFKVQLPLEYKDKFANMVLDLWSYLVKPIIDFLGFRNDVSTDNLPHITWCPTGALTFLPLHAAGDYDQPRSCVFHYAISSYTPTITALLLSTPNTITRTSRVLGIGQTNTPGHNPLPGTTRELQSMKNRTHNKAEYTQLTGNKATIEVVLDSMEQHDWVHLACHAHQNAKDPTKSGFFLHDGTLDLAAINQRSFKNKGLAFLSACQTATGDETLPDEAVHLASGMLMAGYPSVIATMWSVYDDDAPFVADKVYANLMEHGKVGNGEAGKALHYAVAGLRNKVGKKEFGRWVPYIHIGS